MRKFPFAHHGAEVVGPFLELGGGRLRGIRGHAEFGPVDLDDAMSSCLRCHRERLLLEQRLHRYLPNTGIAGSRYLAEIAGDEAAGRSQELGMIKHIKELPAELEFRPFGDLRVLQQPSRLFKPGPRENRRLVLPRAPKVIYEKGEVPKYWSAALVRGLKR